MNNYRPDFVLYKIVNKRKLMNIRGLRFCKSKKLLSFRASNKRKDSHVSFIKQFTFAFESSTCTAYAFCSKNILYDPLNFSCQIISCYFGCIYYIYKVAVVPLKKLIVCLGFPMAWRTNRKQDLLFYNKVKYDHIIDRRIIIVVNRYTYEAKAIFNYEECRYLWMLIYCALLAIVCNTWDVAAPHKI